MQVELTVLGSLELEITESTVMQDDEVTNEAFRGLDELGLGLVLDDFGTGYSSLSYLRRFAIDRVKITSSKVFRFTVLHTNCCKDYSKLITGTNY